ncbi:MAG: hypothetical protein IKD10_05010 [Lentisphaeria bacterium]|nr:hypothetical protein [Lentisphaerota bacterium]MBR7144283.1 hypothetical protein [Lentisphaeria bacterium]
MLRTILAITAAVSVTSMTVAAEKNAAVKTDKTVKICEKTGKACTGGKNAAHNCKKGNKECSKDQAAVKHQCKKAGKEAAHNCKKADKKCGKDNAAVKHQCKKANKKAAVCEKTGKVCTGGKDAAHNCKKGDKECSKEKKTPAKK